MQVAMGVEDFLHPLLGKYFAAPDWLKLATDLASGGGVETPSLAAAEGLVEIVGRADQPQVGEGLGEVPEHLAAMRKSLETYTRGERPSIETIDNPGWVLTVPLAGTDLADRPFSHPS